MFRGGVSLVTIDVTVVDAGGKPIKGLAPEAFAVTVDGRRQPVRALDYVEVGSDTTRTKPPAAATGAMSQMRAGRTIVFLLDDLSARPKQMATLVNAAERALGALDPGDLVGVVTTSGLGPTVNPTTDRAAVKAALESSESVGRYVDSTGVFFISLPEAIEISRVAGHSAGREQQELAQGTSAFAHVVQRECAQIYVARRGSSPDVDQTCPPRVTEAAVQLGRVTLERAMTQLSACARAIEALRPAPAPRVILALSQGVVTTDERGGVADLTRVSVAAAKAGVQFYALTDIAEYADVGDLSVERAAARREERGVLTSGVKTVAEAAGGEGFTVNGNADAALARILAETAGRYQLIVETPAPPPAAGIVDVKVSVNHPGATVRVNPHAAPSTRGTPSAPTPSAAPPTSIEDALQTRLEQDGSADGVSLALGTARRRGETPGTLQLGATLRAPAATAAPLMLFFALIDAQGAIVNEGRQTVARAVPGDDFWATFALPAEPGRYRLRVAAADREGHIGAAEQPVTAELTRIGRIATSDILATWTAADASPRFLALDALPRTATGLRVTLELYPDDPAAAETMRVRFSVIPDGAVGPVLERQFIPARNGNILTAGGDLPIAALDPGPYTIRATIIEAGTAIGSISRPLRKSK